MKKKVLFISDVGQAWGGSEELWSKLAVELVKLDYNVSASLPWFGSEHSKVTSIGELGVKIYFRKKVFRDLLRKAGMISSFSFLNRINSNIENIILKKKPDLVVFSQSHVFSAYEAMNFCNDLNIKYCSLTQLNSELSWPNDHNFKDIRKAFDDAKMNYFVSKGNVELLQTQLAFNLKNYSIIHNPFSFEEIPNIDWPNNEIVNFAFVGRLDFIHKGIDILLRSLSLPQWKNRKFNLNMYGSGNLELAKELVNYLKVPNVKFMGHFNDITEVWKVNHVLLLPSRYEGMALSMIEAMYCKRVVITTDVAGHSELIEDSNSGYIAEAATVNSFSSKLEEAWAERVKWENIGKRAYENIIEKYTNDPVSVFVNELKSILK